MTQGVSDSCDGRAAENRALREEVNDLKTRVAELEQVIQQTLGGLRQILLRDVVSDDSTKRQG